MYRQVLDLPDNWGASDKPQNDRPLTDDEQIALIMESDFDDLTGLSSQ